MARFQIPRSWDPGYAIPSNMRAEGLQRGTYTTRWAPRGTYDDPQPATLDRAYAVPDYIVQEGYGQGAKVSHWAPRGTFAGEPAGTTKKRVVKGLGDDAPLPPAYARYGKRAARAIMLRIQAVPPASRKAQLKLLLDAIDPSLWTRTDALASKLVAQGRTPGQALQIALARALGGGIAGEIVELGVSRSKPQARSLLGLGCYGCHGVRNAMGGGLGALGDVLGALGITTGGFVPKGLVDSGRVSGGGGSSGATGGATNVAPPPSTYPTWTSVNTWMSISEYPAYLQKWADENGVTVTPAFNPTVMTVQDWAVLPKTVAPKAPPPEAGQCSADGAFQWNAAPSGGFWSRTSPDKPCGTTYTGPAPTQRDSQDCPGGVSVTDANGNVTCGKVSVPPAATPMDFLRIGPWILMNKENQTIGVAKGLLTPEQLTLVMKGFMTKAWADNGAVYKSTETPGLRGGSQQTNLKDYGWGGDYWVRETTFKDDFPVARFKHPDTGKNCAVVVKFSTVDKAQPKITVSWEPVRSLWERFIKELIELIAAIIKPILEELGDLACQLVSDPTAAAATTVAAGAAGTVYGGPTGGAAAVTGVGIAQKLCGGGQKQAPPADDDDDFPIVPVAIAGGAVLLLAALWPKKKKP